MLTVTYKPIGDLIPYARNSRTHSDVQVAQIAASIKEFGFTNPVLIDEDGGIIAGHGRVLGARKLGMDEVPTIALEGLTKTQRKAYVIADNKLALNAGWDEELLKVELEELQGDGFDIELLGFDADELADLQDEEPQQNEGTGAGILAGKFLVPPFSVLNAREGWWQDRKRSWIALGIKSEIGRKVEGNNAIGSLHNREKEQAESAKKIMDAGSCIVFDPVLCEIAYRWFCPEGGTIVDPFAGGSVRGLVAAKLGRQYIGGELRAEQVEANRAQVEILDESDPVPVWHCGDSRNIDKTMADVKADFVFSCPPYADLEVYSDNPSDLSTLAYAEFKAAYFEIIAKTCVLLKNDRFACFVVGEVRDKRGNYYNFVGDTVEAFRQAGLAYYNEAILLTAVGSLPIRAGKQFSASRKVGKTHQNVLVFVKGDGKKAAQACGVIEIDDSMFDGIEAVGDDQG